MAKLEITVFVPQNNKQLDSYLQRKIALEVVKSPMKNLQQHSGAKKWRVITQKGLLGTLAQLRYLGTVRNNEGWGLSISARRQVLLQSPVAYSVEDPSSLCC